jgi:hypothetical protein
MSDEEAYREGQRVMKWTGNKLGIVLPDSTEDNHFHGYFGVLAMVAVEAWKMMEEHNCLPLNPKFVHFLWALAFMKLYPANDKALSSTVGGSDPETIRMCSFGRSSIQYSNWTVWW